MVITKETKRAQVILNIIMIFIGLAAVIPFILLIVSSFTDDITILQNGYSFFPKKTSLKAYKYLIDNSSMITHAYGITILVTFVGTVFSLIITSLLAYPISRKDLPYRKFFTVIVVITLLFNGGLVPTYLIYTEIFHIKNTIWALLVPSLLMNGFNIMLVRTYYITSIPDALIESAKIDGAGEFTIFYKIVLPLSLPILATIGLMTGIMYWNDWNNGLIYINKDSLFSIQLLLNRMIGDIQYLATNANKLGGVVDTSNLPTETIRMAIAVIGILPILAAYPFFQKYFVKGITLGAVKG
ncbi:carbohydrate ABC transporter permease [Clostridium sp. SYSU_GA19001]|uniref:carbohydrate ABC transporter permease n=1 Tax=Clostridium caldaquaticum TaxID=2940653 RepID=UPI002077311F|nr:carbohydrate ABC transporter permease [Clostridium caldaquaticum]MCM8710042.1 carbohydrate ABC transporter permease [Clostridium caldaquaticum]